MEESIEHEYLKYLNDSWKDIKSFLEKEGPIEQRKMEMFFERLTSPFVFWKQERKPKTSTTPLKEDEKESFLSALIKKFDLAKKIDGSYMPKKSLDALKFKELSTKMKEAGYSYKKGIGFTKGSA